MAFVDFYGEQVIEILHDDVIPDVTNKAKLQTVLRMFPIGEYFNKSDGWVPAVARAIARFISRFYRRKAALETNMDPRRASELLPYWEETYGLTPTDDQTIEQRRSALLTKIRARGGVVAEYYRQLCVEFGYPTAVVTDAADPFTTESLCDDYLADAEWKLSFKIYAETGGATRDALLETLIREQLLAGWHVYFEFV
jgi:uncharacterized protein YmfQ (DUF2313 family)